MSKLMDITGHRFGRLVVIERAANNDAGRQMFLCKCDCGSEKKIARKALISGNTKSCGCLYIETALKNLPKRKPSPNAALIQILIDTAIKVCEEKGQLSASDLRQCQVEGNAQMISYALHIAVQRGTLVKLGKRKGRFIYGLKPDKPEAIVTGLNWCGIAPFGHNIDNVAGGYRL